MADEDKLSVPQALHGLYKGLSGLIGDFEQKCLELRKAETEMAKANPVVAARMAATRAEAKKKRVVAAPVEPQPDQQAPGPQIDKNEFNPAAYGPQGPAAQGMVKAELCKACGTQKAGSHDCDEVEKYAKGEIPVVKTRPPGSSPDGPGPEDGVRPGDKKSRKAPKNEGNGGDLEKAGPSMGGGTPAAPTAPKAAVPKMPKLPKLPGPAKTPKGPAMGAGTPSPAMKAEPSMKKAVLLPGQKPGLPVGQKSPDIGKVRTSVGQTMDTMLAAPAPGKVGMDPTWSAASKPTGKVASPFDTPPPAPLSATVGVAKPQNLTGKAPAPVALPGLKQPAAAARPSATPPPIPAAASKPATKPVK